MTPIVVANAVPPCAEVESYAIAEPELLLSERARIDRPLALVVPELSASTIV